MSENQSLLPTANSTASCMVPDDSSTTRHFFTEASLSKTLSSGDHTHSEIKYIHLPSRPTRTPAGRPIRSEEEMERAEIPFPPDTEETEPSWKQTLDSAHNAGAFAFLEDPEEDAWDEVQ